MYMKLISERSFSITVKSRDNNKVLDDLTDTVESVSFIEKDYFGNKYYRVKCKVPPGATYYIDSYVVITNLKGQGLGVEEILHYISADAPEYESVCGQFLQTLQNGHCDMNTDKIIGMRICYTDNSCKMTPVYRQD